MVLKGRPIAGGFYPPAPPPPAPPSLQREACVVGVVARFRKSSAKQVSDVSPLPGSSHAPDFFWRALWSLSSKPDGIFRQPFVHHIYNVVFHAVNGAILSCTVFAWTKRRGQSILAGLVFVTCALLTEAVSGIVGIADVLGGMGALLALAALSLPGWAMRSRSSPRSRSVCSARRARSSACP